jgi:hypothetical protein
MARNPTQRTHPSKPAASKQGIKQGEALTRAIAGNTIVDSSLRPGSPDGASTQTEQPARRAVPTSSQTSAPEASRHERIARGAYYRAEARGFTPGQELDDWLAAERELGEGAGEGVIG